VLDCAGELDLAAAPALESELELALGAAFERIVVDLSELEFIDSTGLSVLVKAHQRAQDTGVELGIVNPTAQVERLLSLTGLSDRLALGEG